MQIKSRCRRTDISLQCILLERELVVVTEIAKGKAYDPSSFALGGNDAK